MIKNKFKIVAILTLLLTTSLIAKDFHSLYSNENSLVGIEVGYSRINSEFNDITNSTYTNKGTDLSSLGLKIGAETQSYRIFLSANYYNNQSNEYDYIATYGGALQYKFNISKESSMFVGFNGGLANMKLKLSGENVARSISKPYLGGDVGFSFVVNKAVDFELGARYINIQASNIKNSKNYILNDMMSYYASFVFKFKAD